MQNWRHFFQYSFLPKLFYLVVGISPFVFLCLFLWYMGVNFGPGGATAALELLMGLSFFGFGIYLIMRIVRGTLQNGWYALHRSMENTGLMIGGIILVLFGVALVGSFLGCFLLHSCPHSPIYTPND